MRTANDYALDRINWGTKTLYNRLVIDKAGGWLAQYGEDGLHALCERMCEELERAGLLR